MPRNLHRHSVIVRYTETSSNCSPCLSKFLPHMIWELILSIRLRRKLFRYFPSYLTVSILSLLVRQVSWAIRVNSCTRSLNSASSSTVGGTNPFGCFDDAVRFAAMFNGTFGHAAHGRRTILVIPRRKTGENIITASSYENSTKQLDFFPKSGDSNIAYRRLSRG